MTIVTARSALIANRQSMHGAVDVLFRHVRQRNPTVFAEAMPVLVRRQERLTVAFRI